jgi:alpha-L-fucosidase
VTLLNENPKLIWNNRLGGGYDGDTETPEQFIPATGYPGKDWESCMTINDTWGYKSYDTNFKSTETLLLNLIDIASKGGNYLLNVGPDANGVVPELEQKRLREMGAWLVKNGEAIYGTSASLFAQSHMTDSTTEKGKDGKPKQVPVWDWRATTTKNREYVEVFTWPDGTLKLPGLSRKVTGAYLLGSPAKPLKFMQSEDGVAVTLSGKAPDAVASVVVLKTAE